VISAGFAFVLAAAVHLSLFFATAGLGGPGSKALSPPDISAGDIRSYGAKCDGLTDDTAAIQEAIRAGRKHILVPEGTCIIAPAAVDKIFDVPSGTSLWIQGAGIGVSVLQIKAHAGDYSVIFGPKWAVWPNFSITDLTVDENSVNNPVSSTIKEHGRLLVASGRGNSLLLDRLEVRNVNCMQVLSSTTPNTTISNSRFISVGGGSVYHDASMLYLAADNAIVTGNLFKSSGINSAGAVTAIETHGGKQTITGNVIDGYEVGMNISGIEAIETNGVTVTGNVISDAYYGIQLWSNTYNAHRAGYGLSGVVIANNTIHLKQASWRTSAVNGKSLPGNSGGVFVNATSDLPLRAISITGNVLEWELQSAGVPTTSTSMGIGYWDATNRNRIEDLVIKDNLIVNPPVAGIYLGVGGANFDVSANTIINPGSALDHAIFHSFKSGILVANLSKINGLVRLSNNYIEDSLPVARMSHGIYIASHENANILATGDVVSVTGGKGEFLGPLEISGGGAVPRIEMMQAGAPLTAKAMPTGRVAPGSTITDVSAGATWIVSDTGLEWRKLNCGPDCQASNAH
jgi:Pectate lyase superfamily protein